MQKNSGQFTPFSHENIEIKKELLKSAREFKDKADANIQELLASVFIYTALTEYLAEHLLINLKYYVKAASYNQYAGILFIDEMQEQNLRYTLGQNIKTLRNYSFPDKDSILECMKKVVEARNTIFHNFAKSDLDNIIKMLTKDLLIIADNTEKIIQKIDVIYEGLRKVLSPTQNEQTGDK